VRLTYSKIQAGAGISCLLTQSENDRQMRIAVNDRQRSMGEQVKILSYRQRFIESFNECIIAIHLCCEHNNDHMAEYLKLPDS